MRQLLETPAALFDLGLARRLNRPGPRYTSYPTAVQFHGGFGVLEHAEALEESNRVGRPLSLYVHIPFCAKLCHYCGCHMLVTHRAEKVSRYISALEAEIDVLAARVDGRRPVVQMHWGGGTPTILAPREIEALSARLRARFDFSPSAELSIEADPRTLTHEHIAAAARAGFGRLSLGVQTFDPLVQEAIGRVQPVEMVADVTARARYEGFSGIAFDVLYGLPHQTAERFARTLDHVVALAPQRVAVFGYAHVPWLKKHQSLIAEQHLPGADGRLELYALAYERLVEAGYVAIGMDHFALQDDPLAVAQRSGELHRNFQGYTTRAGDADVIGLGISAISDLGGSYAQNAKGLPAYYRAVEKGALPTERGCELSGEDRLRRHVIRQIMCGFEVVKQAVDERFGIAFDEHFAEALTRLEELEALGVVELRAERLRVMPRGRPFVRNVAMAFDAYLEFGAGSRRFSQTV